MTAVNISVVILAILICQGSCSHTKSGLGHADKTKSPIKTLKVLKGGASDDRMLMPSISTTQSTDTMSFVDMATLKKYKSKVQHEIVGLSRHLPYLTNLTVKLDGVYQQLRTQQVKHVVALSKQIDIQIDQTLLSLSLDSNRQAANSGIDISYCTFATSYGVPETLNDLRKSLFHDLKNKTDAIIYDALSNVTSGLRGVIFIYNFIKTLPSNMAVCDEYDDQISCLDDLLTLRQLYVPKPFIQFINRKMKQISGFAGAQIKLLGQNYQNTIYGAINATSNVVNGVDECISNAI